MDRVHTSSPILLVFPSFAIINNSAISILKHIKITLSMYVFEKEIFRNRIANEEFIVIIFDMYCQIVSHKIVPISINSICVPFSSIYSTIYFIDLLIFANLMDKLIFDYTFLLFINLSILLCIHFYFFKLFINNAEFIQCAL